MSGDIMNIDVNGMVAKKFPKEYVEAVIQDALKILPSYLDRKDTLVVVNQRGLAILLDHQTQRGMVILAERIEQVLDGDLKAKLKSWLTSPSTPFYVMHIAGSWFANT